MIARTPPIGTAMRRDYLRAQHGEFGDLYAAWAPNVAHVEPGVRSGRFAARLAPFPNREAAERALIEAGAVIEAPDHAS